MQSGYKTAEGEIYFEQVESCVSCTEKAILHSDNGLKTPKILSLSLEVSKRPFTPDILNCVSQCARRSNRSLALCMQINSNIIRGEGEYCAQLISHRSICCFIRIIGRCVMTRKWFEAT